MATSKMLIQSKGEGYLVLLFHYSNAAALPPAVVLPGSAVVMIIMVMMMVVMHFLVDWHMDRNWNMLYNRDMLHNRDMHFLDVMVVVGVNLVRHMNHNVFTVKEKE